MSITEFRYKVIDLCANSGYRDNADEIKNVCVSVKLSGEGMNFTASTARKITVGHHQSISANGHTIEECLKEFEKQITVAFGENNIELK